MLLMRLISFLPFKRLDTKLGWKAEKFIESTLLKFMMEICFLYQVKEKLFILIKKSFK